MDREQAKQEIRSSWQVLLPRLLPVAQKKVNGQDSYICPKCGHGTHGDGLTFNRGKTDGTLTCFGCNEIGDVIDVYQAVYNCDYNTALNELANTLGITIDGRNEDSTRKQVPVKEKAIPAESATPAETKDYTQYYLDSIKRLAESQEAISYLQGRGISLETAQRLYIGFDAFSDPRGIGKKEPRIIIPTSKSHYLGRAIRESDCKAPNVAGSKVSIFNGKALKQNEPFIFIVEGVFDALSIEELGYTAIATNSANHAKLVWEYIDANPTITSTFILLLDADDAGQKAQQKLLAELTKRNIKAVEGYQPAGVKDINEALVKDRQSLARTLQNSLALAKHTELDNFIDFIQTDAYRPYKTGLDFIDQLFAGGITRQSLLVLMAPPATGKTTLCIQLAETMAENQQEVIYLNLEMSKEQMLAKAISYRLSSHGAKYSTLDILQGYRWTKEDRGIIMQELSAYKGNIEPYLHYNPAGVGSDLDEILDYLQRIGKAYKNNGKQAPVMILDYLHLVSSKKLTDAQEIVKQAVAGLKQYAIDYNSNVIAISACNRNSQEDGVISLTSGRDSSAIEYTGDYVLALNFWELEERWIKPKENRLLEQLERAPKRQLLLKLLKNRLGTPAEIKVFFDAKHNRFYKENFKEVFIKPSYADREKKKKSKEE